MGYFFGRGSLTDLRGRTNLNEVEDKRGASDETENVMPTAVCAVGIGSVRGY